MATVRGKGILFGGFLECFNASAGCDHFYYPEVTILDYETKVYQKQPLTNPRPAARTFHGMGTHELTGGQNSEVIVLSGIIYNVDLSVLNIFDDMWRYNPNTNQWAQVVYANTSPGARLGMQVVIIGQKLYTFGGFNTSFMPMNDMWSFDFRTNVWTQLTPNTNDPTAPGPRFVYQMQVNPNNNRIYIFGGNLRDGGAIGVTTQYNDTWAFDIATNTWIQVVSTQQDNILGRTHASSALVDDTFIVALGDIDDPSIGCNTNEASAGQNPTAQVVSLRVTHTSPQWRHVPVGFSPIPLKRIAFARHDNRLWITTGYGYTCDVPTAAVPLWNTGTYSLPLESVALN